ncbi:preprotein translocase subunit SecG [Nitrolancea hollandica]|uniref:Protein-export membrane protein SecG n=1 Tax=Nitrolancea hollandica Lb TaxID=1129897 RepID=I4EEF9_9BACT|nr:preprotein translocase subunit SecG [Nitrolancea hollandica]CCF83071.1 Preprotein translocase, SecG subunit [Nitrolancea hollandica Lb]
MEIALNLAMILVSIVLMIVILAQSKGSGFSGAFGGDSSSIYRSRRGVEKVLFQFTIAAAVVFILIALLSTFIL